jgi:quinoprotein glucose dehydrogenase
LWTFDPQAWQLDEGFRGILRGIAYWSDGDKRRIFYGTSTDRLYSIDITTGKPDPNFGQGGFVDLGQGLRRRIDRLRYCVTSAPTVCRNVVVVGAGITDWHDRPPAKYSTPGDVRGFDAHTGEQLWVFQTVPQEGETGNDTWENDAWKTYGQTNVWAAMSADDELGYVYLPVSSTTHNHYGGERPGANLFSNSLVCLEAKTGKRVWHYQFIHHGVWNYDLPAPPVLADIEVNGKPIKAIAQISKQAFCYVLDRVTGEPVWPIKEKKVPKSKTPGEKTWPTQPIPSKPAPYDRQGLEEDDLIDFTPQLRQKAIAILEKYRHGPLYTPPSEKGTMVLPGGLGGSDWSGAGLEPNTNVLYVPSRTRPDIVRLQKVEGPRSFSAYAFFMDDEEYVDGLPLTKPPYARITAIDLDTGEHVWMSPVGRGPVKHEALRDMDLPDLGWFHYNFVLVTRTILVVASQKPHWWGNLGRDSFVEQGPYVRAFDLETGTVLAEMELPGNPNGSPITYMADGRQYIVFPVNDDNWVPQLVALSLPQ